MRKGIKQIKRHARKSQRKERRAYFLLRHKITFNILRPFFKLYFKLKYNASFDKYKGDGKGAIIISNHTITLDPFFVAVSFNFPVYFVASDQLFNLGFVSRGIQYLVSPIAKSKGKEDVKCIKDIVKCVKDGGAVGIFVEGNRTFTGITCTIPNQIGKLIKMLKRPVICYNIIGGYLTKPRWAIFHRKGKIEGKIKEVWQPEEYKDLTDEEVYERVKNALYVDAYEEQSRQKVRFRGKKRAENLENVLYFCPNCKKFHTLVSSGNELKCQNCGATLEFTEYGLLKSLDGKISFTRILDWYNWQNDYIISHRLWEGHKESPIFSMDNCEIYIDERARRKVLLDKGQFALYQGFVTFKGKHGLNYRFKFEDISGINAQTMGKLVLYTKDGKTFVLMCDKKQSILSYVVLFYVMKNEMEGKNNDFLGI